MDEVDEWNDGVGDWECGWVAVVDDCVIRVGWGLYWGKEVESNRIGEDRGVKRKARRDRWVRFMLLDLMIQSR